MRAAALQDPETQNKLLDILSETTWTYITNVAKINTQIFEDVFRCIPSNEMTQFEDVGIITLSEVAFLSLSLSLCVTSPFIHSDLTWQCLARSRCMRISA